MPVEFRDYYATLGVKRDATPDEIKQAFRKLARKYHPDVAADKRTAEEKFKEVNEAHEVIGDPEKRRKYDELGARWNEAGSAGPEDFPGMRRGARWERAAGNGHEFHFDGTGFSDFFEQFFGRGGFPDAQGDYAGRDGRRYSQRGQDVEGEILVTLDEVMRGTVRPLSLRITDSRTGEVTARDFQVRIPPGAEQGRRIRVPGKGEAGTEDGEPGDLLLRVRYAAHPDFTVQGADLFYDLPLAPWEVVLGAQVEVPSLTKPLKLRIPAGTEQGRVFRIRGHGLPRASSGQPGDLHVVANIRIPTDLGPEERRSWEELRRNSSFAPRKR